MSIYDDVPLLCVLYEQRASMILFLSYVYSLKIKVPFCGARDEMAGIG
jgi:hypothetical protein